MFEDQLTAFGRLTARLSIGVALATAAWASAGCSQMGPGMIEGARFDYNDAIVRSFDQQMLLNLVRLRYQDSILFLDLTSVVASYERAGNVGVAPTYNAEAPPTASLGASGGMSWSESPTISYAPLQGEDFAKRLLAPIQPNVILLLSRSGWGLERLLVCTVQQLNELPNGTAVGGVAPIRVHHFRKFRRVATLLRNLQEAGFVQINAIGGDTSKVVITPGPIPIDDHGREEAAEFLSLLKIVMPNAATSAPPPTVPDPSDVGPEQEAAIPVEGAGFPRSPANVVLTGRSVLGVMAFLAQQVDAPPEHVRQGLVRVTLGHDGKPFDWNQIAQGLFHVQSSSTVPEHAFLRVRYRGYWFYIDDRDLESKSTYTLVSQLFSLQAASGTMQSPLLTIPAR